MSPMSPTLGRTTRSLVTPLAVLGVLAVPPAAHAESDVFHRFEANAVAIYRNVTLPAMTARPRASGFRITGGHEDEAENGVVTEDHDFLTVFVNDTGTAEDVDFVWSPSLQTASLSGTVITRNSGHVITANVSWEATSAMELDTNTNAFPGWVNHFVGRERAAVARGRVVYKGRQFVDGSTTDAGIETLEDTNRDVPVPPSDE